MRKSATAIQQWLPLRRNPSSISSATHITRSNNPHSPTATSPILLPNRNDAPSSTRPFHSTIVQSAREAAPADSTLRARDSVYQPSIMPGTLGRMNKQGIWLSPIQRVVPDVDEWMSGRMKAALKQYQRALNDEYVPDSVSRSLFLELTAGICAMAARQPPDGHKIRKIHGDVDMLFIIGYIISTDDRNLREWMISACALAGARLPVTMIVARQIRGNRMPARNEWYKKIEKFAQEGYPQAMMVQAKIHIQLNELKEPFALLENRILPYVDASSRIPSFFESLVLDGMIESPWRLYAWLLEKHAGVTQTKENQKKADLALRVAAEEYQDPEALTEFAGAMMIAGNLDLYEECMLKAATAGKSEACLFIANFYYLTYLGKYPTRAERKKLQKEPNAGETSEETPKPVESGEPAQPVQSASLPSELLAMCNKAYEWTRSFFHESMDRKDYAALAKNWYDLAYFHGQPKATLMVALLERENQDFVTGMLLLERAQSESPEMLSDTKFKQRLLTWKERWYDEDYEPTLGLKDLPVY